MEENVPAITGRTITGIRPLTKSELAMNYWYQPGFVLLLDNGSELSCTSGDEGNAPGVWWLTNGTGEYRLSLP